MTNALNRTMTRPAAVFVVLGLCVSMFTAPALAQRLMVRPLGPPPPPFYGGRPYGPPSHHGHSDFDKALTVIGTVGAIAAIANARNSNYYYSPYYPYASHTVVVRPQPTPLVVEKQIVIEKPVVVEQQVPVVVGANGSYSPKLGASFRIENMQIPGYKFTAARLTSDPLPDSPLNRVGLRKGDVITRLDDTPAETLAELERHSKNTLVRYIKTGTTKVLLANVYIPTDAEMRDANTYYAP